VCGVSSHEKNRKCESLFDASTEAQSHMSLKSVHRHHEAHKNAYVVWKLVKLKWYEFTKTLSNFLHNETAIERNERINLENLHIHENSSSIFFLCLVTTTT
jgi:hypothetical protein